MQKNTQQQLGAFGCSISMVEAALSYPHFQDLMGVSRASHGKRFGEWTEADQKLWTYKFQEKFAPSLYVEFRYMPSEGCFFVRNHITGSYLANLYHKTMLYRVCLPEDYPIGESVEFRVYTRNIQGLGWSFTVALYWNNGKSSVMGEENDDFNILCDIPMTITQDSSGRVRESMKKLGFEVEYYEALDGREDEFGEFQYFSDSLSYKKNGINFRLDRP